tara:strand:+ start:2916 stop:3503 length:588 start_codon:yes stop_codon:yes gene_type:complete
MDIKDHYRTEFWAGTVSYGKFTEKNWLAIGGIRHPLFQSFVRELKNLQKQNKINFKNYKLYVCGGVLEDWVSWDVDFILVGKPSLMAYKILYNIKKLAFELKFYIDVNLQPSLKGVIVNCGNIKKWNGQYFKIKAWEISNKFITTDPKGNEKVCIYKWKKSKYGLYEEDKIYPFTKNLIKYQKEGFIYKEPRKVL